MLHASSDHEIIGHVMLKDEPHALNVVAGITPVAKAGQIAEVKTLLLALCDTSSGKSNLAGHECLATTLRLMVEKDARAAEHIICLTVLLYNPIAIEFSHSVRGIGMERCILVLRHFFDLSIKLGSGSLVDATRILKMIGSHGLEDTKHTRSIDISRKLGGIETYLNMALCCKIVDFSRLHLVDNLHKAHRIAHISIMEVELGVALKVSNTLTIVNRTAADDAMHFITLADKELRQIRTVLASDARDKGDFSLCHNITY